MKNIQYVLKECDLSSSSAMQKKRCYNETGGRLKERKQL